MLGYYNFPHNILFPYHTKNSTICTVLFIVPFDKILVQLNLSDSFNKNFFIARICNGNNISFLRFGKQIRKSIY